MYIRQPFIEFEGRRYFRNGQGYYRTSRKWEKRQLHRDVWSATHGPIPPGIIVHHIDGNPSNNDLSNLEGLTRKEHSARHGPSGACAEPSEVRSARRKSEWTRKKPSPRVCAFCARAFV